MAVFHLMFFVGVHSEGRFFSLEIPEPSGPLHCGQFPAAAFSVKKPSPVTAKAIPTISVKAIRFTIGVSFVSFVRYIRVNPRESAAQLPDLLLAAGLSPNANR